MSNQIFQIITKPYLDNKDLQALTGMKRSKCQQIMQSIKEQAKQEDKVTLRGLVSTERAIKYLGINPELVYKNALKEQELWGKQNEMH
jgi:hypothetical protein